MNSRKITKTLQILLALGLSFQVEAQTFTEEIAQHRENYKKEFVENSHAPLDSSDLKYLDFYEADESYKVKVEFKAVKKAKPFEMQTTDGRADIQRVFGELTFEIKGQKQTLQVYQSLSLMKNPMYRDYLFIPFKDLTNGTDTYGGGRYIDLRMKELEVGAIYLDFNKAYNPYCAYSAGYSCPIPPKENHLKVRVEAGERAYKGEYKK